MQFNPSPLAGAFTIVNLLYLPRALFLTLPAIGMKASAFLKALAPATLAAAGVCVVHLSVRAMTPLSDLQEIALSLLELAIAYALLTFACRHRLQIQIKTLRALMLRSAGPAAAV